MFSFSFFVDQQQILRIIIIALSCVIFVSFLVIGMLIWRLRRTVPDNRTTATDKSINEGVGLPDSPRDQHVSEPGVYMELHPRCSQGQSREPPEYQSLQDKNVTSGYYNVGFKKENAEKGDEVVYDEVGNTQC